MTKHKDLPENGLFEAPYVAFLETVTHLRPQLHRYCARMVVYSTEGEDVMQEALVDAYHMLDTLEEGRALRTSPPQDPRQGGGRGCATGSDRRNRAPRRDARIRSGADGDPPAPDRAGLPVVEGCLRSPVRGDRTDGAKHRRRGQGSPGPGAAQ